MKLIFVLLLSWVVASFVQAQPGAGAQVQPGNGPNLPAQKIHANDLVGVSVYGEPDLTRTVRVGDDGTIRLPLLRDKIKADGLMPEQFEQAIVEALKSEELLVDPFVTVIVAEYHTLPISVAGAVKTPIAFQPLELGELHEATKSIAEQVRSSEPISADQRMRLKPRSVWRNV